MILCRLGLHRWKFKNARTAGYLRRDYFICLRCGKTKDAR